MREDSTNPQPLHMVGICFRRYLLRINAEQIYDNTMDSCQRDKYQTSNYRIVEYRRFLLLSAAENNFYYKNQIFMYR